MQIIFLHNRLRQAKSVTVTHRHLVLVSLFFLGAVVMTATLMYYLTFRFAANRLPFMQEIVSQVSLESTEKKETYLKENLSVMAMKLGEMQAQLVRLNALGERVQGMAGVSPEEFNFKESPGVGGVASSMKSKALNLPEFQQALDALAKDLERRADYMSVIENNLTTDKIKYKLLPTTLPISNVSYNASGFGKRIDPFTGRLTMHEGIDFAAPSGTPIVAAAGGVVIAAEFHPQYGNMIDVDHGNDIVTRYAHASQLLAKVGDIVKRGQRIGDIGSTGRSTGSHLHFEVHVKGLPQDPHRFLSATASQAALAAAVQ